MKIGYTVFSKSWYARGPHAIKLSEHAIDEVMIRVDGAQHAMYEFAIRWFSMGSNRLPALRVEVFEDSFGAFNDLKPLFDALVDLRDKNPQLQEVVELLRRLGYCDDTSYLSPHGDGQEGRFYVSAVGDARFIHDRKRYESAPVASFTVTDGLDPHREAEALVARLNKDASAE